ncbi:MAG: M56 family metallopeptidase [Eubacteriales bacterium]|nr:M56 family metallopeptidase [Eubacteriales bacterium]
MRTATVYNFLLEANLMASIAVVLMIIVRKCFRRSLGNKAIYFGWLLISIRLLCPLALPNPAINQIRPFAESDQAIRPIAGQLKVRFFDASQEIYRLAIGDDIGMGGVSPMTRELKAIVESEYNGMLSERLMELYALGATLVLCWFAVANLRFRHRLKSDRIEPISGKLLEQYRELCTQRKVKPVPVYFTDPLPSACLVGVLRPYIALPLTAKPQEAIHVLNHEISHLQGHDQIWAVLRLLCCAVHWFNPLVWLAAEMSRVDGELACDDRVVEKLNTQERMAYANVLVLAAARRNAPGVAVLATGMTMTGKRLKSRVSAILHSGQIKRGFVVSFMLLSCMALVGAFATAEYKVWPTIPTYEQAQSISSGPIASSEDAVARAKEILANPYFYHDVTNAEWEAHLNEEERPYYSSSNQPRYDVMVRSPDFVRDIRISLAQDGTVLYFENGDCGYADAAASGSLYGENHPEKQEELYDFALGACAQLATGVQPAAERYVYTGDGDFSNSSQHFTSFSFSTDACTYQLGIQTVPTVRIVLYDAEAFNS